MSKNNTNLVLQILFYFLKLISISYKYPNHIFKGSISYGSCDMEYIWWRTVLCFFEPEAVFGSLSFSSISLEKSVIATTNWSRKHISNVIFITQVSKRFKRSEMKDFKYFVGLISVHNNKIHMEREYYRLKCYCPNRFPI